MALPWLVYHPKDATGSSFLQDPRFTGVLPQTLWLLVLIGFVIRAAMIFVLNDYRQPLAAEYGVVAGNLAAGRGFIGGGWLGPEAPTALNTPIYPLFLAAWMRIGGSLPFLGVELSQALLSSLIVYLVGQIALRLANSFTSLLAAIFTVLYPPLIYFCIQISPAIFTTFFTVLSCYVLLLFFEELTWKRAIVCGLVFGVSLLVEPILLYAIPGMAVVAWMWWHKGDKRAVVWKLIVSAVICGIVILPWTIRNYLVFHRVIVLKTSFGLNLWMGNNPNATGFLYTTTGEPMQNTLSEDMRAYLSTLNEAERYAMLGRWAWEWIRSHPEQFLQLTIKRVVYLWWISPTYQVTDQNIVAPCYFYVARAMIQAMLLLPAFLGSILACWKKRQLFIISIWWLTAFTVPYAVSVAGNTRYRLPAEPALVILAAFCFAEAKRFWNFCIWNG